jgi:hypothetical protein
MLPVSRQRDKQDSTKVKEFKGLLIGRSWQPAAFLLPGICPGFSVSCALIENKIPVNVACWIFWFQR